MTDIITEDFHPEPRIPTHFRYCDINSSHFAMSLCIPEYLRKLMNMPEILHINRLTDKTPMLYRMVPMSHNIVTHEAIMTILNLFYDNRVCNRQLHMSQLHRCQM